MTRALLAFGGVLLLAIAAAALEVHHKGKELAQARTEVAHTQALLESMQTASKATNHATTKLAQDRVRIYTEAAQVIHDIPTFIPPGACELPAGFRVLHDAAATGQAPEASRGPDGPAVPAEDLAATIADNYTACRDVAAQLGALQQWVNEVSPE
jgi:hypothetical protein